MTAFFENRHIFSLNMRGFLCLMAMKFCRIVKTVSTQLPVKKNLQILLKSSTEHAPKI